MIDDQALAEGIDRIEALTAPTLQDVRTTFTALDRTVASVGAECRSISQTLDALGAALQVVTQSGGMSQQWGGFGIIGLPIVGAMRAAQGITSQYVKQQTGVSLTTWTDLVASSSAQFEAYLSQLETVAALSQRYHTAAASPLDPDEAREDQKILRETRWRTQAWKQVLGRVAQLGRLVDTIVKMNLTGEPGLPDADRSDRSSALASSLQKRIKDVQSRTVEKSSDLREWVLQPFVEIRDSVKQLPSQTERLAQEVALLEVLLELEVAEIRACLGEIPPTEARVVGLRVAAGVTLPELGRRLATARQRALAHQTYLDRLDGAHSAGDVDDRVHAILSAEYRSSLATSRSHLAELEAEADVWRRDGQAVLDACADWMTLELAVQAARTVTEQREAADERRVLLQRELDRVNEARSVLATL